MRTPLIYADDTVFVSVRNLDTASNWYQSALGCRPVAVELDEPGGCVVLGWKDAVVGCIVLGPPAAEDSGIPPPVLFAANLEKAMQTLRDKGVSVGHMKTDRAGTKFFEFRDLEENVLEVCSVA